MLKRELLKSQLSSLVSSTQNDERKGLWALAPKKNTLKLQRKFEEVN